VAYRPVRLPRAIADRGSVFDAGLFPVATLDDVKAVLARLTREKEYRSATHNVVAYRLLGPDGRIVEHKDDGVGGHRREPGAGRVVLEVLRAREAVGALVVVSRHFGGVKLGGDRFRHFAAATAMAVDAAERPARP
jgi:putative IMPACT (imprinted ancient) family translation regulator